MDGKNRPDLTLTSGKAASEVRGIFPIRGDNPASTTTAVEGTQISLPLRHLAEWRRALAPVLLALVLWLDRLSRQGIAVGALYVAPALLPALPTIAE
jgi:hypothetical protein